MSSIPSEPGPRAGHLGTAWETALVAVSIVVVIGVICVVVFHVRRQKAQLRELEDLEKMGGEAPVPRRGKSRQGEKPSKREKSGSLSKGGRARASKSSSIPKPTSSTLSDHHEKSHSQETLPPKPQRYYWDRR